MPEILEVERYRQLADLTIGERVRAVDAPDDWYLKGATTARSVRAAAKGATITGTRRIGKLLLVDLDNSRVLGLRFGMTGRLIVGGTAVIEELEYSSTRDLPAWDRFALRFESGTDLRLRDPRRLGGVEVDPDVSSLGPDALSLTLPDLRHALGRSRRAVKAILLDQGRIAGVGNLLADETLWRSGIDPARSGESLTPAELRRLHRHLRSTLPDLTTRGGSHMGDLQAARHHGAVCPKDGAPLLRRTIGGRTTYSCPKHQR